MIELFLDDLDATNSTDGDHTTNAKSMQQEVTQIINWIQYFSAYITMVSCAKLGRIINLIAYLNLIINSHIQFQDLNWALYDHQF